MSNLSKELSTMSVEALVEESTKIGILSDKEQRKLIKRYQELGDKDALEKLILCNGKLVIKIACKYYGLGVPIEDLVNSGIFGVIISAGRFDLTQQRAAFITYAIWWIHQQIKATVRVEGYLVRLPQNRLNKLVRARKDGKEAMRQLEREDPSSFFASQPMLSLDAPVDGEDGDSDTEVLDTLIVQYDIDTIEDEIDRVKVENIVQDAVVKSLDTKESTILRMRFSGSTLDEVGEQLGITREGVRLKQNRAIKKLRRYLKKRGIQSFRQLVA